MNIEEVIKKYQLSDEDFEKHCDKIFNFLAMSARPSENPKFVMVGGQAGSGKTGLVTKKNNDLDGGAIIIDQDEIRVSFPKELYDEILEKYDDREEYLILKPYVLKMRQALVDRAREGGYNVIMESAMQAVDSFIPQVQSFKDAGYRTELSVISVPNLDCFLSTLSRYCHYLSRDGYCRRNTKMNPEMSVKLRNNLVKLDETGLFDDTEIYIRGNLREDPPRRIYSKKEKPEETPLHALDRGERLALESASQTFMARAKAIRETLNTHHDEERLEQLNWLENEYKNSEMRRDDRE